MPERFAAFSFVDRITRLEPGVRAQGCYAVPPSVPRFPPCFVAESVGQLAAWVAMSTVDFRSRPVTGLAGETRFFSAVKPGQTIELAVEIESCGEDAIAFGGSARVDGTPILELARCVAPMLPSEQFDAPEALRADLEVLRGAGAPLGRLRQLPEPDVTVVDGVLGEWMRAELHVPASAPFFADHFPRRPVLPGTLLLQSQIQLALRLASEALRPSAATWMVPVRVSDVKMRSFVPPGGVVEIRIDRQARTAGTATVSLGARVDGRPIATGWAEIAARGAR